MDYKCGVHVLGGRLDVGRDLRYIHLKPIDIHETYNRYKCGVHVLGGSLNVGRGLRYIHLKPMKIPETYNRYGL